MAFYSTADDKEPRGHEQRIRWKADKASGGLFGCMDDPAGFACSVS